MIFATSCKLNASPGPSPGAPLKSDCVAYQTETRASVARRARYSCPAAGTHSTNSRGEVDSVKEIKHVRPKLNLNSLGNRNVFDNRKIDRSEAWPIVFVAREVPDPGYRNRERRRIPPLCAS